MKYKLDCISERDVDFALMREMGISKGVQQLFFNQIKEDGELYEAYHSLVQEEAPGKYGESDILFIFKKDNGEKFAIFVEDKVAADAQPDQRSRYDLRAKIELDKWYKRYFVFLCAPKDYLIKRNSEDKKDRYKYSVSHEEISLQCKDNLDKEIFLQSCEKKQNNTSVRNEAVTNFWNNLIDYIDCKYNRLIFNKVKRDRGGSALWLEFGTNVKGLSLCYKSDQNVIVFQFSKMAHRKEEVRNIFDRCNIDISKYHFREGTSELMLSVELPIEKKVFFLEPFDAQKENIDYILKRVSLMHDIANKIGDLGDYEFPLK